MHDPHDLAENVGMAPSIAEIHVADDPDLWASLGFAVEGDRCRMKSIDVVLTGAGSGNGIHGWAWRDSAGPRIEGIPSHSVAGAPEPSATIHPNSSVGLFYVVLMAPSWDAAANALADVGVDPGDARPMGDPERPTLRSLAAAGDVEIEVIGPPEHDPNRRWNLWGSIVEVADVDATAGHLGDRLRPMKPAMQRGRRIATLDRGAGSSVALAFMGPREDL